MNLWFVDNNSHTNESFSYPNADLRLFSSHRNEPLPAIVHFWLISVNADDLTFKLELEHFYITNRIV